MAMIDRINPLFAKLNRVDFSKLVTRLDQDMTMLGWADPFFPDPCLPSHVLEATKAALDAGLTHYTVPIGSPELRRAVTAKLKAYNGLDVDPDYEVIITPGSDMGLYYAMRILIAPGDEVLNPDPSYSSNHSNAELMGATSVRVPLREESGFQIEIGALEARLSDRTKLIVLTQPNNPTSTVYSRKCLEELSHFAIANDLFLVVDQAFEDFIYDKRDFVTVAALPGMWERTITVFSTSKGFGLSGYRVGYNVAHADLMAVMHSAAVNVLGTTNSFAQAGAVAAFRDPGFMAEFGVIYERRRRRAFEVLNAVPGVHCLMPESGFVIWVNVAVLGSSAAISRHLVDHARVIVSAGTNYGPCGEGYIRIVLGSTWDDAVFEDALLRVAAALTRIKCG